MTPHDRAVQRASELQDELDNGELSPDERAILQSELDEITDNIAEGCYSRDPDDGVDWSNCPGIC